MKNNFVLIYELIDGEPVFYPRYPMFLPLSNTLAP